MRKPNFFIIGAPKCGTTSLANWLSAHPSVFVSAPKEPMFFDTDFGWRHFERLDEYETLFRFATDAHIAVGEASTFYLCSLTAVPGILEYAPDARFIVMLRRPSDMVVSLHAQACRGFETETFERAWRLQSARARGSHLPRFAAHPELYQYGYRCRVGTQLDRLFGLVPRKQVLVVFLEDFRAAQELELERVQAFLGLPALSSAPLPHDNARTRVRSVAFKTVLNGLGHAKRSLGISHSTGLLAPLYRRNIVPAHAPQSISPALMQELDEFFTAEIELVQKWVGRVPATWIPSGPRAPRPSRRSKESISVIIPTYNDGEYLHRAIESVIRQELPADEVIVVDDGSAPPGPARFLEPFLKERTNVRLLRKSNGGPSSARNFGLRQARSTHVAFLDADDWWEDDFLSSKVRLAQQSTLPSDSYAAVYGNFVEDRTRRRGKFRHADGNVDPDCIGKQGGVPGGAPMYLFRREPLITIGGFDEDLVISEDFDLIARLIKAGHRLLGCATASYRRTVRTTSWSRSSSTRTYLGVERFLDKAASLALLSEREIGRRRMKNALRLAKDAGIRWKSPRMALTLCRRAFSHAPPERPAEVALWLATRAIPAILEPEVDLDA